MDGRIERGAIVYLRYSKLQDTSRVTHRMEMPSALVIQDRKITHYLLIFQEKDDKSQFLARAGYTLRN